MESTEEKKKVNTNECNCDLCEGLTEEERRCKMKEEYMGLVQRIDNLLKFAGIFADLEKTSEDPLRDFFVVLSQKTLEEDIWPQKQ